MRESWQIVLGPIVGFLLLGYAIFCLIKKGTHVRGKGWQSKEQAPKLYVINQTIYLILGLLMLIGNLVFITIGK